MDNLVLITIISQYYYITLYYVLLLPLDQLKLN